MKAGTCCFRLFYYLLVTDQAPLLHPYSNLLIIILYKGEARHPNYLHLKTLPSPCLVLIWVGLTILFHVYNYTLK